MAGMVPSVTLVMPCVVAVVDVLPAQAQSIDSLEAAVGAALFTLGDKVKVNPLRPEGMPLPELAATVTKIGQAPSEA